MNILVTGANGQLGKTLIEEVELHKLNNTQYRWFFAGRSDVPVDNYTALEDFVVKNNIHTIVNCAAFTNVDGAERDEEKDNVSASNIKGPYNLGKLSREYGVFIIHISTDYVFDGKKSTPYSEDDTVNPLNYYGMSKLAGEDMLSSTASEYVILRTSFLYSEHGDNFVKKMIKFLDKDERRKIVVDQIASPTYARDLCYAILRCLEYYRTGIKEIYHFADKGVCSRYDFARMVERFYRNGAKKESIFSTCMSDEFKTPATRPMFTVFDTSKIERDLNFTIPFWVDSLEKCVTNIKNGDDL